MTAQTLPAPMPPAPRDFNLRAELRLALLAGAESCWLYAIVITVGIIGGLPHEVSPFGIFIVYWLGLLAGRQLPRLPQSWRVLQILTVLVAILAILIAIRVGLYTELAITDFSWLPLYFRHIFQLFEHATPDDLSTFVLIFAFIRALGFAGQPLTLWTIGFQFRLGIVIFFVLAGIGALSTRVDFTLWIFVYFAFFLVSIALARIEDAGRVGTLGSRWAMVMLSMLAVILLIGYAATQLLTLRAVNALFAALAPVALIGEAILLIIALPIIYVLDFIFHLLSPLFKMFADFFSRFFPANTTNNPQSNQAISSVMQGLINLAPYLRLLGVILVMGILAWWIARTLNKRMNRIEEEMSAHEPMTDAEAHGKPEARRPRSLHLSHREIQAENVRRIYAALQAHAESFGLKRLDAETPNEYLPRLAAQFPESNADLSAITSAYVAVHYAQQNPTQERVQELRQIWLRLRDQMKANEEQKKRSVAASH